MIRNILSLFQQTFQEWNEDNAPRLAAALSYFTVFSIAPFLLVVISNARLVFGREAVQGRIFGEIQGLVGPEGALFVQELLQSAYKPGAGIVAAVIGVVTLLLGAAGVFGQLQGALNLIWDAPPRKTNGIISFLKDRFLSFSMLLGVGFLLLVSLVITSVIGGLNELVAGVLPAQETLIQIVNFAISFVVITAVFALMFKFLPDVKIQWRDVIIGAAFTALLFNIGKILLGLYLGNSATTSAYGAAGSLVLILLWVFYSAQIMFFGAEFTQVYARTRGSQRHTRPIPAANAPVSPAVSNVPTLPTAALAYHAAEGAAERVKEAELNERARRSDLRPAVGIIGFLVIMVAGWFLGKDMPNNRM